VGAISFETLLAFAATCLVIELAPGPNMAYLAVLSASKGRRAGFAATLGISRQHLHQLETGQKSVSPERAVRFARLLGQSESYFLQLALQDLANDSGIKASVQVKVA